VTASDGFPRRAEVVRRYAEITGFDVARIDWYVAFAYFKLAVILEGIHCRHLRGLTVGDGFADLAPVVPELLRRGHTTLDQT
jgi:aminoglycoside phosphotransferase (APT) family kinase protein